MEYKDFLEERGMFGKVVRTGEAEKSFLNEYRRECMKYGTVIENGIQSPTTEQVQKIAGVLSPDFRCSVDFLKSEIKKSLSDINAGAVQMLANSMMKEFEYLRQKGKSESILKNVFSKYICWLTFDFRNTAKYINSPFTAKVLHYGKIKLYETVFLKVLSECGCNVIEVLNDEYCNEANEIAEIQQGSYRPQVKTAPAPEPVRPVVVPTSNSNSNIRMKAKWHSCTNVWTEQSDMNNILKDSRGTDTNAYYNCFYQVNGVFSKADYLNQLIKMYKAVKNKRNVVVVNEKLPFPSSDETAKYNIQNCTDCNSLVRQLADKLRTDTPLNILIKSVFIDFMLDETDKSNLSALKNNGIIMLCYLEKYRQQLFDKWKYPDISCFIFMGSVKDKKTAMFLNFLSHLPVDVLVLNPQKEQSVLSGKTLIDIDYENTLDVKEFPNENTRVSIGTTAYHAEQEIHQIMSDNNIIIPEQTKRKANTVCLQTMYEEIFQLWNEELRMRPSYNADDSGIVVPVIFAKVSGIKNGDVPQYWKDVKKLITDETIFVSKLPFFKAQISPQRYCVFDSNRKLECKKVKEHSSYRYGILRDDVQEHILNCLQKLLDTRMIRGTFEDGTENDIIKIVLNLDMSIVNLIQNMDFVKVNPKIVYFLTDENPISKNDAILLAYLNIVGFDVVFFVPTGYQTAEKYYADGVLNECQNGNYEYNIKVPNLNGGYLKAKEKKSLKDKLFNMFN